MKPNTVRIIGGRWRGRHIHFPDVSALRPSGDRIRETLFNWLQKTIHGAQCLDLFAGSGVLGFEALSRGAESVVFVEENREIIAGLKKTAEHLSAKNYEIIPHVVPSKELTQKMSHKKFDIVFLDPPFEKNLISIACNWLVDSQILEENALIYIETERSLPTLPIPADWQIIKAEHAGQVSYYLISAP